MFDLNTKVVVLHSTQKTGAGPRKGSIGHVIKTYDGHSVDHTIFAINCLVHFNRFGFEQKSRSEVRSVINVLPLISDSCEIDPSKQINTFCNHFNSTRFDETISRIMEFLQANKDASVVIMVPCNEIDDDLLTCSPTEFELWVKMIGMVIGSTILNLNVNNAYVHTNNPLLSKERLHHFYTILNNRLERDLYIDRLIELPEERRDFILTVRGLLSMYNCSLHALRCRTTLDCIHNELHHTYMNGRFTADTTRFIYKTLYNNMYNISFDQIAESFVEKPKKACIKNVTLLKSELKNMATKLLSENNSN